MLTDELYANDFWNVKKALVIQDLIDIISAF